MTLRGVQIPQWVKLSQWVPSAGHRVANASLNLPSPLDLVASKVDRRSRDRRLPQVISYPRQFWPLARACVACVRLIQCALARRSFSVTAGWPGPTTSAACRKKRRIMAHRRAPVMPVARSSSSLATTGVFGSHRAGVTGKRNCARWRSSALRAIGGTTTLPGWPPLADHLQPSWSSQFRSSKFSGSPSRDRAIFMR